jgi:3',5'-cyclic AMP phosphodiesterase CpdA
MAVRFRLLHLSDLHVAERTYFVERGGTFLQRYGPKGLAERYSHPARLPLLKAVARLAYQEGPLDAILITGDLSNWGDVPSLRAARNFVMAKSAGGWHDAQGLPTLQRPDGSAPIHLLPGNHDRYLRVGGLGGPGGLLFDEVFQGYWQVGQGVTAFVLGRSLGVVMGDMTLTSAAHGTSFQGGFWGQGKAYVERIAFMKVQTELLRAKHPALAVLWAVHFAPEFKDLPEELRLIDGDRLIEAAQELDVRYLLCGHTHSHLQYQAGLGQPVTVFCVGSAAQRNGPSDNTLNLFDVEVESGAITRFEPRILEYEPAEGFRERSSSSA